VRRSAMEKIEYFDYVQLAKRMGMPNATLKKIEKEVRKEFPSDRMLYELHVLRAVKSKYWQKK
jgi:transcriptional regulator with XRE-family HTH domain